MTVTLELKPEVEARVVEQAASRGVPVEDFLESVIEESLKGGGDQNSYQTPEEWEAALDELADSSAFGRTVSFVDDSRESIYREREDSQL
jgi:hypothetical protein